MAEHPNTTIVRRLTEGFVAGDMQLMDELLADDVVWHEIGRAEPRRGKAELRALAQAMDYKIDATVHDMLANDDHAVVLIDATATRGDGTLRYRVAEIYHIRGGRITERWAFSDDTAAIVDFFA